MQIFCEVECTYHDAAMHPGPQRQFTKAPPLLQENSWEGEDDPNITDVRTSCTEVCGSSQRAHSCSKICLGTVYPKDSKHKAIKAYVILDDQSNRSLAIPEFFELFGVKSKPLECPEIPNNGVEMVIAEVCLGTVHKQMVDTFKTHMLVSGRHSIFQLCTSFHAD